MNEATSKTENEGEAEAVVIVKAAPQVSAKHGETVCCAAVDPYGNWLRLYPVSFRHLADGKKFGRWDRIRFHWRRPRDDTRLESRRIDQETLSIIGKSKKTDRENLLRKMVVTSLDREREKGHSLALLQAEFIEFYFEKKSAESMAEDTAKFQALRAQADLFSAQPLVPYSPAPYRFKYRYRTDDGVRDGTCQDWEIEWTFMKWSKKYGEDETLVKMTEIFAELYPEKGMLFAMGTHSRYPDVWLINGIIRLDEIKQLSLLQARKLRTRSRQSPFI